MRWSPLRPVWVNRPHVRWPGLRPRPPRGRGRRGRQLHDERTSSARHLLRWDHHRDGRPVSRRSPEELSTIDAGAGINYLPGTHLFYRNASLMQTLSSRRSLRQDHAADTSTAGTPARKASRSRRARGQGSRAGDPPSALGTAGPRPPRKWRTGSGVRRCSLWWEVPHLSGHLGVASALAAGECSVDEQDDDRTDDGRDPGAQ